jgi:hypothetical protein
MFTSVMLLTTALVGLVAINLPSIKLIGHLPGQEMQRRIFDKDDGSGLSFEEDKPRIDRFAEEIKRNNSGEAYIIAYGGLVSYKNEARIRLNCIRDYLKTAHGISRSRLKLINGGHRPEVSVELFLVKTDETKPTAYPIVNREAVQMRKAPKCPCGKAIR